LPKLFARRHTTVNIFGYLRVRQLKEEIGMKTLTMGEYYVWYCEWCDSRNLTPWTRTTDGNICCGGCHKEYAFGGATVKEKGLPLRHAHL
jgi:hypothetical protein